MTIETCLPFTRAEALRAGISIRELTGPRFVEILHGVYLSSAVEVTTQMKALAALRVSDRGSWVSHHTAGLLWGGCMPEPSDLHVTSPEPARRSIRRGVFAHRARAASRPVRRHGILLSPPVEIFLDLASLHTDLVALVVAGDSLVKETSTRPKDLVAAAASAGGQGARLARRAAAYVREGVDSAQETRLRMLLVLAGLPEPTVNLITRFENGEWKWRFDLSFPELKVVVEYDGEHHRENGRRKLDEARRAAIRREGWLVIVVTRDELRSDPAGVLERVQDALRERGCTGLRRKLATAWQRHFPVWPAAA